jgi:hypothetical protein
MMAEMKRAVTQKKKKREKKGREKVTVSNE